MLLAESIAVELRRTFGDHNVFVDTNMVRVGQEFDAKIAQWIESCQVVVLLIGKRFALSDGEGDWVARELKLSRHHSKTVIPALVDDAPFPKNLPEVFDWLRSVNACRLRTFADIEVLAQQILASDVRALRSFDLGLSVSVPEDETLGDRTIDEVTEAAEDLAEGLLQQGATLFYGGLPTDMSKATGVARSMTKRLRRLAQYHRNGLAHRPERVVNFVRASMQTATASPDDPFGVERVEPPSGSTDLDPAGRESVELSAMRVAMAEVEHARICLGGRLFGYRGRFPGIVEEAAFALDRGTPVFLLGGFGGGAQAMAQYVINGTPGALTLDEQLRHVSNDGLPPLRASLRGTPYPVDFGWLESLLSRGVEGLNNGLTRAENEQLARSTDMAECLDLVIRGLRNRRAATPLRGARVRATDPSRADADSALEQDAAAGGDRGDARA